MGGPSGGWEELMPERIVYDETAAAFFHDRLLEAMKCQRVSTSAFTECYLVNLLAAFVHGERMPSREPGLDETPLALLYTRALEATGQERSQLLRATADTALFVSGFFGDSLNRSVVDLGYYGDIGRFAYGDVASTLAGAVEEATWPQLFEELADRFRDFVDLLAEVSDRAGVGRCEQLLRVYERYLETGSERDRRRLLHRQPGLPQRTYCGKTTPGSSSSWFILGNEFRFLF